MWVNIELSLFQVRSVICNISTFAYCMMLYQNTGAKCFDTTISSIVRLICRSRGERAASSRFCQELRFNLLERKFITMTKSSLRV